MKDRIIEYNEYLKNFGKNDFVYIESSEADFLLTLQKLFENINSIKRIYSITNNSDLNYFIQATCRTTTSFPLITWTKGRNNFSYEEIENKRIENKDIDLVVIEEFNELIKMELERRNIKDNYLITKGYLELFKKFNCPILVFEPGARFLGSLDGIKSFENKEFNRPILKEALNHFSKVKAFVNRNIFEPYLEEPLYYDCYDVKEHTTCFVSLIECYENKKYVTEGNGNGITLDFISYRENASMLELNELDSNVFAMNCIKENINAKQ